VLSALSVRKKENHTTGTQKNIGCVTELRQTDSHPKNRKHQKKKRERELQYERRED
jgi:hypothetical protein